MKNRYTLKLFTQKAMYTMLLLILLLPTIASAANDSFVPSFKDGMNDLPDNVKFTITRVINWSEVALVAVAMIYTAYHGISAIVMANAGMPVVEVAT